jgi:hypothetical protein
MMPFPAYRSGSVAMLAGMEDGLKANFPGTVAAKM